MQSKCFVGHFPGFGLFALHLKLVCLREKVVNCSLQCLTLDEAPLPLVATFAELVPGHKIIFVSVPFGEESLILSLCDRWNLADSALIDCKSVHHLN